jgi:hypothetical protein
MLQKYFRLYDYIQEYQRLILQEYSKHAIAFLITYYNLNIETTIWEDEKLFGGPYDWKPPLSGVKFNKILLLPVFFTEEIATAFNAEEIGQVKENETNIIFPYDYKLIPYPNDRIKLEQSFLRPTNNVYPMFRVSGVEAWPNTDKRFWKLKIEIEESFTETDMQSQVENVYSFVEYDKKIHTLQDSEFMTKILSKSSNLRSNLNSLFDQRTGFYYI